jgi:hypothetical protein
VSYPNLASMSDLPGWLATELAFYGLVASPLTGAVMGAILSRTWLIDPQFGGRFLDGGSPDLLFWVWLALAVPVWCGAAVVGRWLDRSTGRPPSLLTRSAIMSA